MVTEYLFTFRTSPSLNILLYNAIGSKDGDELYGTEPASYYIINLLLNMGTAWIFVLLSPMITILRYIVLKTVSCNITASITTTSAVTTTTSACSSTTKMSVMYMQAFLWLLVLFSRPHKVTA